MSIDHDDIPTLIGRDVHGSDGKLGQAAQIYLDDVTGKPEWVTVKTGLLGTRETFVPVAQAQVEGDDLRVPYDKETVKDAPTIDSDDDHLSQEQEAGLYRHYGLDYSEQQSDSGLPENGQDDTARSARETRPATDAHTPTDTPAERVDRDGDASVGRDTSGPTTDDAMTRSEEQLAVGTQTRETGRARLRKHVVTEQQTVTVPTTREEVTIEREPITDADRDAAVAGPDISEEEHEVVLTQEVPVVDKKTVPVERVRMGTETITDAEQVTDTVRKEQIDTDGVDGTTDREESSR
ncbi:MAG: PRC and DUF2382 domain-containing protein [Phycicoccus sp.]